MNMDPKFYQVEYLLAGISGGAVSTFLLYPLDLVKVRLQVKENTTSAFENGVHQKQKSKSSITRMMRGIIRHEGVQGLYAGVTPAIVGSSASWGGYFFLYEGFKRLNKSGDIGLFQMNSSMQNFSAACYAGAVMVIFTNPLWLVKTRMQLQMKKYTESTLLMQKQHNPSGEQVKVKAPYKSVVDAFRTIVREEGFLALYKGAGAAMLLVSNGGVQFVVYELLKSKFGEYSRSEHESKEKSYSTVQSRLYNSVGYLTMGAVSKVIASTITYPLQVIKSRLQQRVQGVELLDSGEVKLVKREYANAIDCIRRTWKVEGIRGFFSGCIPNALRVAPSAAVTFVTYESTLDFLLGR